MYALLHSGKENNEHINKLRRNFFNTIILRRYVSKLFVTSTKNVYY